jgi:sugar lactone lactonase YvrE
MKKIISALTFFLIINAIHSQSVVGIGQWQEYLSYRKPISLTVGQGRVYCATQSGVFWLSILDNSMQRLSKINGLSDVDAANVKYNAYNKKVLVAYKNTNLDILKEGEIINIPDIKNKSLFGNKVINNVYMDNQFAYLACGFGIVVLDMDKEEIKDSYNMDPLGNAINVRDITMDNQYIYAATDGGVYKALRNSNLSNYNSWSKMTGLPTGIYNAVASVNGKLYTNLSNNLMTNAYNQDVMYVYENGTWAPFTKPFSFGYIVKALRNYNNQLLITTMDVIYLFDNVLSTTKGIMSDFNGSSLRCFDSDFDDENNLWVADTYNGLLKKKNFPFGESSAYVPDGPASQNVYEMCFSDDDLWVVPGGLTASNGSTYTIDGISIYSNKEWKIIRDSVYDILNIVVDPVNPKKAYTSSFCCGVVEYYNKKPVVVYGLGNSTLQAAIPGNNKYVWTNGLAFDKDNNLWVANSGVETQLSVKMNNGSWKAFNFSSVLGKTYAFKLLIDKSDQKWFTIPGGGLVVFKGTVSETPTAANTKLLAVTEGKGHLPSPAVFSIAEDLDGEIWIGTDKGVAVFYNPESMFSGQNYDAQTIKLEQDGNVQLLLETETVQAIAVDAGNRKWMATANSGVYLMSEDGTKQIHHFDEKNSPLFSNNVKSIVIDHKTGEVFFGTARGIISYRGDAIEGQENFTDVYAFPNPVKDNYSGPIVIKGLVNNTIIKITDISGSIVNELTSLGGQAIWDAKNFKGEKVSTGVYMVFCTNQDGSQKIATKILVIN